MKITKIATSPERGKLLISSAPQPEEIPDYVDVVICLLEWKELSKYKMSNYPGDVQRRGIKFYHIPTQDMTAPNVSELTGIVPVIIKHLSNGENVLVHCLAGLGRSGVVCACCLMHYGLDGKVSMREVRLRRPGSILTTKQENCVLSYARRFVMIAN